MSEEKTMYHFDWTDSEGNPVTHGVYLTSVSLAKQYARALQGNRDKAGDIEVYCEDGDEMELVLSVPKRKDKGDKG